ncbi:hypothetical protein RV11_GL002738 [Enterococcus phoeniculicola]|nr:hypothetical protein RV11_GL002738 [Enterococcus phoeniculicola]
MSSTPSVKKAVKKVSNYLLIKNKVNVSNRILLIEIVFE